MKIAFCITCKNRTQHLEKTLPLNLAHNADYPDAKFIVLDYNSQDHLLDYLRKNHAESIESGRLAVYSYREKVPFQVAHAKNMAHRLGILEGADILVNLDADNYTGPGFATFIAEEFQFDYKLGNIFLFARMIQQGPDRLPRGINGRIAVTSQAFLKVGGYDERFATWSPDDKDFNLRLRRLGYQAKEIDRRFLNCILHNDRMRFKHVSTHEEYGDPQEETINSCDTTVVNGGTFGCGTVYKLAVSGWRHEIEYALGYGRCLQCGKPENDIEPGEHCPGPPQITLGPLPTRIFGIGLHKTATTSLHHALQLLGFESGHWKSAYWAKAIWDEMTTWNKSHTLEKHYALCDLPIPLLYEKLDQAYPGSKFILTLRNEGNWLQSVQNHWSHESNRFRASWSTDPFTHKVHKLLYGTKGFDADVFLARYRRHNAEVLRYFQKRPEDLLIMDMDRNPGWSGLCAFLGRPVPEEEYPMKLVTRKAST